MARDRVYLDRLVERECLDDPRIASAFRELDRADFVPPEYRRAAYEDRPVSLPAEQTTSQPTLIVRMVAGAALEPDSTVLEIGTGFGFQTALLAKLARRVYSVERHAVLAESARENIEQAGIGNFDVRVGDGWLGWPEHAPYDAIVVSAAAESVPEPFELQLKPGGRLVIPVTRLGSDDVLLYVKTQRGLGEPKLITPARFVPLVKDGEL